MNTRAVLGLVIISTLFVAAGCTVGSQRPVARHQAGPPPSAAPQAGQALPASNQGWVPLGQRVVDFRADHDAIRTGDRGRFRAIRLRVEGSPLEMFDMRITFGNGQVFSPNLRHRFAQGSGSRHIDLPGGQRIIQRIDFAYRSVGRPSGKATVHVAGQR